MMRSGTRFNLGARTVQGDRSYKKEEEKDSSKI